MTFFKKHKYIVIPASLLIAIVVCMMFFAYLGCGAIQANGIVPDSSKFGLGLEKANVSGSVGVISDDSYYINNMEREDTQNQLAENTDRNISNIITDINKALEQRAREEAERKKRIKDEHFAKVSEKIKSFYSEYGKPDNLTEIDWYVDEDVFVTDWAAKIDVYLIGTPMEGKGNVFAKAAWDNCVDPRWSPAISNTESSKGYCCFKPHNAWGWGDTEWEKWEDAINDHVKGLADKYGYTIAEELAEKYCPPNSENWYNNTLDQMRMISDETFQY